MQGSHAHLTIVLSLNQWLCTSSATENNMRIEFVECVSRSTAQRRCPWAAVIAKVCGGFRCFESVADYTTWKNQR
jgi:hypothetical protein